MPVKQEPGFAGETKLLAVLPNITIIDSRGDLIITAREKPNQEEMAFRVCPNAVFRASSVLEGLARDTNVRFGGQKVISLRDTDPTALRTILNIIHGNFSQVLRQLKDKNLLHDVVTLTNRFDMTACLAPIAEKWFTLSYDDSHDIKAVASQLRISHELGHVESTRAMIKWLLTHAWLNSDGELIGFGPDDKVVKYREIPALQTLGLFGKMKTSSSLNYIELNLIHSVTDKLKAQRSEVIKCLIAYVEEEVSNLINKPFGQANRVSCASLGALQWALKRREGVWAARGSQSPHSLYCIIDLLRSEARSYGFVPPLQARQGTLVIPNPLADFGFDIGTFLDGHVKMISLDEEQMRKRQQELGLENVTMKILKG